MTFSIVAQVGDAFGVAVASKFIAVGSVVPAARLGVGAVATQAFAKVSYKADVLDLLAAGADPAGALATVTAADAGSDTRQLGIVSATSQVTFTGAECNEWAGGRQGRDASGGYAIQGNILVGERVVDQMEEAWLTSPHLPVASRLLHALLAGDRAGGDRRGRQSAALYVVAPGAGYDGGGVLADLRVDDHPEAPTELARLLDLNELYFGPPSNVMPLEGPLGDEVRQRLSKLGREHEDVKEALADWAGEANFEMRLSPDGIDARVLQALREATA
jgi:uncharacterized Ntn-hydrolase superfamily protein